MSIRTKEGMIFVSSALNAPLADPGFISEGVEKTLKIIYCSMKKGLSLTKLILMFVCFELVCVACDKNINIELTLDQRQCVDISPWNNLMAMTKSDSELSYSHYFLFRITKILYRKSIVLNIKFETGT